jgi:hypothetical protein
MATIYSTTTDIASFHGKVVLFTGDRTGTCECIPVILPPQSAFEWKKCSVVNNKEKLLSWYTDNLSKYGKLWDPTANDGPKVELHVPRMIALPLRVASHYRQLKGAVMPQELLDAMEKHLASPATHRRMAVVGTQPSPSLSLHFARMPYCPTTTSFTGG